MLLQEWFGGPFDHDASHIDAWCIHGGLHLGVISRKNSDSAYGNPLGRIEWQKHKTPSINSWESLISLICLDKLSPESISVTLFEGAQNSLY